MRVSILTMLVGCSSSEPETKESTNLDDGATESTFTGDTGPTKNGNCPLLKLPVSLPVPLTWCIDRYALDAVDPALDEQALGPAFDRWDDLVPDQALFTYLGECADPAGADLVVGRSFTPVPTSLGSVLFVPIEPPGPPMIAIQDEPGAVYSPVLSPDTPCDGQFDLETIVASSIGTALGIPIPEPECDVEPIRTSMMYRVGRDCEARFPNAWDIEQFNAATGSNVPLP